MAELSPPSPAWRTGLSEGQLDTRLPYDLKSRGYIPTWPARAVVFGVAGVPSDATVPEGTVIAQNTLTDNLYVKRGGVWQSVNGEI